MPLVIDIETIGQQEEDIPARALEHLFRELEAEELAPEERSARRREIVERFGLDPTTGRIVCIGLLDAANGREEAFCGADEERLLTSFWDAMAASRPDLFVTFNGRRFDFPYINLRSAILGLKPSMVLPLGGAGEVGHFDVREALAGEERRRKGSLDYFCAVFGIVSPKEKLDGERVARFFQEGRLSEIAAYCLADCRATAILFDRLRAFYGV